MTFPDTIVLAGGLGTRIRSELEGRPKVLAPVAGQPFADHLLKQLSKAGSHHVIFATGHGADQVAAYLDDAKTRLPGSMRLDAAVEASPLGTGGAVRNALDHAAGSPIMVMNGDSYVDCPLDGLFAFHKARHANATMLLVEVLDAKRYGTVQTDSNSNVISFTEKSENLGKTAWINAGIYIFERRVLEHLQKDTVISLEHDLLPSLCGFKLYGYKQNARFIDIGTPESFAESDAFFGRLDVGEQP